MTLTLYADILFMVNFFMNSFILWIVAKLTRRKTKARWVLLGAAVMSLLYTLLIAVETLRFMNVAVSSVIILVVGVFITFHPGQLRDFAKIMAVSYAISFMMGGLGMALMFLTDVPYAVYHIARDWTGFRAAISWQLAFTGMVISYALIKLTLKVIERVGLKRQLICSVTVSICEIKTTFDALVDTGHNLREPLSKAPVIIAEFDEIKTLLPDGIKVLFYEKNENDLTALASDGAFYSRIRLIPFSSLGRTNGMLVGFRPDSVIISAEEEIISDGIIGIYNGKLNNDGGYRGLMSPEIINVGGT